jgi:hypothetical protein
MHRLLANIAYLCGPMDRVADGGIGWRNIITPLLNKRGIIVFDPCNKPLKSAQSETNKEQRLSWVAEGRFDLVRDFMKEVRGQDLRMINKSDFVIAYIDVNSHLCGSYEEIAIANHEKKPILVFVEGGKAVVPWWLMGQLPLEHIFGSMEEVLEYLDDVDSSPEVDTLDRWFFFDQKRMYTEEIVRQIQQLQ